MAGVLLFIVGMFFTWFAIVAVLALPRALSRGVTRALEPSKSKTAMERFVEEYRSAHAH